MRKEHIEDFGYLFLVDIDSLDLPNKSYADYERREPNYSEALLSAYHFAFNADINRHLSSQFIQAVHAHALQHMPAETPGSCKNSPGFFPLGFPTAVTMGHRIIEAANPTATAAGFWQFVDTWIIKERNPVHFIHIRSGAEEIYFLPVNPMRGSSIGSGPCLQILNNGRLVAVKKFDAEAKALINEWLFSKPSRAFINSASYDLATIFGYDRNNIQDVMLHHLDRICREYNFKIQDAKTDREKIAVIAQHMQLIVQLHAFKDGNSRLANLLLNRLLHEEKLPLALLVNPNRLDCFSVSELIEIVEAGQQAYLQFCQEKIISFNGVLLSARQTKMLASDDHIEQLFNVIKHNLRSIHPYYLIGMREQAETDSEPFYEAVQENRFLNFYC